MWNCFLGAVIGLSIGVSVMGSLIFNYKTAIKSGAPMIVDEKLITCSERELK